MSLPQSLFKVDLSEGRSQNYEEQDLACNWGSYFCAVVEN